MFQIFQSKHGLCRKFGFLLEMIYLMLDTLLTLLGPMNFFGVFIIQIISVASHLNIPNAAVLAIGFLYILLFVFGEQR